jgi:hypothetical protein
MTLSRAVALAFVALVAVSTASAGYLLWHAPRCSLAQGTRCR